jgi:hypothetical protein
VARALEHHHGHVVDVGALALRDQPERLPQRAVQVEQVGVLLLRGDLQHVDDRARVEHRPALAHRDDGQRARRALGGQRRALQRVDRDVGLRR